MGVALPTVLLACGPQIAGSERQYLSEGYRKLNAWAYVRERPDGHGFSFIHEGALGEATILAYLRKRLEKDDEALRMMTAAGADPEEVKRLEARKESVQWTFDLIISAGRRSKSPVTR